MLYDTENKKVLKFENLSETTNDLYRFIYRYINGFSKDDVSEVGYEISSTFKDSLMLHFHTLIRHTVDIEKLCNSILEKVDITVDENDNTKVVDIQLKQ